MNSLIRQSLISLFIFLNLLLIALALVSLYIAAWQWAAVVSEDFTLAELVASHARYSRVLLALFLMLSGCLALVGSAGAVAGALLLADKLRVTAVTFLVLFLVSSFLLVTAYAVAASLFWIDSSRVSPLVLQELRTRLQGNTYSANLFQFRSYWNQWQLDSRCCGVYNSTDFVDSVAAQTANSSLAWLPDSCCWNQTLAPGACRRWDPSFLPVPCAASVQTALSGLYGSQLGVLIAIWATYFCLVPVTMVIWGLIWTPTPKQT